jgi:hypothetical protein
MRMTRHEAMNAKPASEILDDEIFELETEISDYVWSLIGDLKISYTPFGHRCRLAIYEYLYEIDPIGLRDEEAKNHNEYHYEASAIFWLLEKNRLTERALWAIWIFYFSREVSPYKDENHPQLKDILLRANNIYASATNEPLV